MGLQVNWRACKMLHSTQILCKGMNLRQVPRESTKHKMVPKSKRLFDVAFWTIIVDWFHNYLNQEWIFPCEIKFVFNCWLIDVSFSGRPPPKLSWWSSSDDPSRQKEIESAINGEWSSRGGTLVSTLVINDLRREDFQAKLKCMATNTDLSLRGPVENSFKINLMRKYIKQTRSS